MVKKTVVLLLAYCMIIVGTAVSYADKLKLKERAGGNEVEIIEETTNDFTVRVPKDEIESIQRKEATEIEIWKQKRILWEDRGDYLVLSIPKERVSTKEQTETLESALDAAGVSKRKASDSSEGTSRIVGRVIKGGKPLSSCIVKIVMIQESSWGLGNLLGNKKKKTEENLFTTITDETGKYEFHNIPRGYYDIYWKVSSKSNWIRQLSDKPNIFMESGQTVEYPDIILK